MSQLGPGRLGITVVTSLALASGPVLPTLALADTASDLPVNTPATIGSTLGIGARALRTASKANEASAENTPATSDISASEPDDAPATSPSDAPDATGSGTDTPSTSPTETTVRPGVGHWRTENGQRFYFDERGNQAHGWTQVAGIWYWFDLIDGHLALDEWVEDRGKRYHVDADGRTQTGVTLIDGERYYLDPTTGEQKVGWQKDGAWRWFDLSTGAMAHECWLEYQGVRYWILADGTAATGWQVIGDDSYWFAEDGAMARGLTKINGATFAFASDGARVRNTWVHENGVWYWAQDDGSCAAGWRTIDGQRHWFEPDGRMATDWAKTTDGWCLFDANGVLQHDRWAQQGGQWYRLLSDGTLAVGWLELNGTWYYFDPNGAMATGHRVIQGRGYLFTQSGEMATGTWVDSNGAWRYLDVSGAMVTGWAYIEGNWYWFADDGAMGRERWVGPCYVTSSGAMATGRFSANGRAYAADEQGRCLPNSWTLVDGAWYLSGSDASLLTGWAHHNGHWYYLNDDGSMLTGWLEENHKWYYLLDDTGAMAVNQWADESYFGADGTMQRTFTAPDGRTVGADGKLLVCDWRGHVSLEVTEEDFRGMRVFRIHIGSGQAERAVFYLHGGAYTSGINTGNWEFAERLAKATQADVIVPAYPVAPFVTYDEAYSVVLGCWRKVAREYGPSNVALLGDSAGGGFAAGLAEWLGQLGDEQPGALVLVSPWLDLSCSSEGMQAATRAGLVPGASGLVPYAKLWAGDAWSDDGNMEFRLSPSRGDLSRLRNVLLITGDRESFASDTSAFHRALQHAGVTSQILVGADKQHDWLLYDTPESDEALLTIAEVMRAGAKA